jgi:hypothetical protein
MENTLDAEIRISYYQISRLGIQTRMRLESMPPLSASLKVYICFQSHLIKVSMVSRV